MFCRRFLLCFFCISTFGWQDGQAAEPKQHTSTHQSQNEDLYRQFQEMKKKLMDEMFNDKDSLMDDFFSSSNSLMNDIDDNLFKSFGYGANLSSDSFHCRWKDEKSGKSFLVTPKKNADLKIDVMNGMIKIEATEKSKNARSTSMVSVSVPEDLDWKKHQQVTKQGDDIAIFFPYYPGAQQEKMQSLKKSSFGAEKPSTEDEMVPVVPRDSYDVI